MLRDESPRLALLVAWGVLLGAGAHAQAQAPDAPPPRSAPSTAAPAATSAALEPRAIEVLKAMSARLAAARSMTFTAVSTYESPTHLGPPLAYKTLSEVTLQRPDKLRVITPGDGPASEFYLDGKTMLAFSPSESFVAVADAPPTIDAAIKAAYDTAAIYFPFSDVIVADPYTDLSDGLKDALYIGQSSVVGGTKTDMVAIVNDTVFAQIWVGAEDKLPRMIRAVYLDDPSRLRHEVELSKWHLDGAVPANTFTSARAGSAKHIPFARPDPKPPADAVPAAKGGSSMAPDSK